MRFVVVTGVILFVTLWLSSSSPMLLAPQTTSPVLSADIIGTSLVWTRRPDIPRESSVVSDGFDQISFPPNGWSAYGLDDGEPVWARVTLQSQSSPASANHGHSSTQTQDGWLVGPLINIDAETVLEFWEYCGFPSYYRYHGVWASAATDDPSSGTFAEIRELGPCVSNWTRRLVSLGGLSGNMMHVALVYRGADADDWYVDDVGFSTVPPPRSGTTILVTESPFNGLGGGDQPAVSNDGRYVVFISSATDLVVGDANGKTDVFVRDVLSGTTSLVSVSTLGRQGDDHSMYPSISADGRHIAFLSSATTLSSECRTGTQAFVHDRITGQTTCESLTSDGAQANGYIDNLVISGNGRYVTFATDASNLVPGFQGWSNVYVRDRQNRETIAVSVSATGGQPNGDSGSPSISGDGRYVAFTSSATNLIAGEAPSGFPGFRNVFVRNMALGTTVRVTAGTGASYDPSISGDGSTVAFASDAINLVSSDTNGFRDVFVHELASGQTELLTIGGNGLSEGVALSSDGLIAVFRSQANNLVPDDSNEVDDLFLLDRTTGGVSRVSVSSNGVQGNAGSGAPSGTGRYVAFVSGANNLVDDDNNGRNDVFLRDRNGVAIRDIALVGPSVGDTGESYTFTVQTSPITATAPVAYVWQASSHDPVTHVAGLTDILSLNWDSPGSKLITVSVSNAGRAITATKDIAVYSPSDPWRHSVVLPSVQRNVPLSNQNQ